eukprot:3737515-Amphidinium_carterae.1
MDGWMDGWLDGWMDGYTHMLSCSVCSCSATVCTRVMDGAQRFGTPPWRYVSVPEKHGGASHSRSITAPLHPVVLLKTNYSPERKQAHKGIIHKGFVFHKNGNSKNSKNA